VVKAISSALSAWLVQRLSALYMLVFLLYALARWNLARPVGYAAWKSWVLGASIRIPLMLFFAALLLHAWIGLRDVVFDYIHPLPLRLGVLALIALGLAAAAFAVAPVLAG
jgi:succinate dehydrogenase / fumarate reductase membrane anchor subunit